jgi:hypothetical protein
MSDAIDTTVAGATRVLFGTIAFICLMVGIEGMTGADKISVGLSAVLIIAGAFCAYAAIFWGTAKKVLSQDAQDSIANFSKHRATKAALLFSFLLSIILSPFIEKQRWPFSYPVDPSVIAENNNLRTAVQNTNAALSIEKELADKWRFATILRGGGVCGYQIRMTAKASLASGFWRETLQQGGWYEKSVAVALAPAPGRLPSGITLRIAEGNGISARCASALQQALTDIYPNPSSKIADNQQSDFLSTCQDCVQIEIDD